MERIIFCYFNYTNYSLIAEGIWMRYDLETACKERGFLLNKVTKMYQNPHLS